MYSIYISELGPWKFGFIDDDQQIIDGKLKISDITTLSIYAALVVPFNKFDTTLQNNIINNIIKL